jgi:hypothetical protein
LAGGRREVYFHLPGSGAGDEKRGFFWDGALDFSHTLKKMGNVAFCRSEGEVHVWSLWRNNLYETAPLLFLSRPWRGNQLLKTVPVARDRFIRSTINIFQSGDNP